MTRAPYVQLKAESPYDRGNREMADTTLGWRFVNPRLADRYYPYSMGETAENVAERWGVSRERQDAFALESHQRAVAAIEAGRFDDQIVPITVPQRKGDPIVVSRDEHPRADTSPEALARLRPAFRTEGGTVTAGNSSGSTTARRRSCSSRRTGRARWASNRLRAWSPPRSPASTPRSWASARSRRPARRSSVPGSASRTSTSSSSTRRSPRSRSSASTSWGSTRRRSTSMAARSRWGTRWA